MSIPNDSWVIVASAYGLCKERGQVDSALAIKHWQQCEKLASECLEQQMIVDSDKDGGRVAKCIFIQEIVSF